MTQTMLKKDHIKQYPRNNKKKNKKNRSLNWTIYVIRAIFLLLFVLCNNSLTSFTKFYMKCKFKEQKICLLGNKKWKLPKFNKNAKTALKI